MESLTGHETPKEKPTHKPDRVTLGESEGAKVDRWLTQINTASRGFLSLTKSDIVNFLIREHRDELLPKEIQRIRAANYDPIKHINWITPQIKQALSHGDTARVLELQEELRKVELSVVKSDSCKSKTALSGGSSPRRKRKPKSESVPNDAENSVPKNENRDA